MAEYLIVRCPVSGDVVERLDASSLDTDAEALLAAIKWASKTHGTEVWLRDRLICRVPAKAA